RNGIRITTPGAADVGAIYGCDYNNNGTYDEAGDGQNITCNFLNWKDLLAYLDWAALRPMTELEYEKICRGAEPAVDDEFAWANDDVVLATSTAVNNAGENNEVSTVTIPSNNGIAAAGGDNDIANGPLRVGF